jgi:hypothetical protein
MASPPAWLPSKGGHASVPMRIQRPHVSACGLGRHGLNGWTRKPTWARLSCASAKLLQPSLSWSSAPSSQPSPSLSGFVASVSENWRIA